MRLDSKLVPVQARQAFTMIELLVVIVIIAILAGLLLPAVIGGLKKADITQAQTETKLLESALMSYWNDFGKFPGQAINISGGGIVDHKYEHYPRMIATLRGSNLPGGNAQTLLGISGNNWYNQNPGQKVYLQVNEKSIATNGSVTLGYAIPATLGDLADPWGNRYVVMADWSGDGQIQADGETLMRKVAVWSWGPDTKAVGVFSSTNTSHIRSWR